MKKYGIAVLLLWSLVCVADENFNRDHHPERKHNEVFVTNASTVGDWERVHWLTKRLGNVAYTKNGERNPEYRPVFAEKSEVQGISPEALQLIWPAQDALPGK